MRNATYFENLQRMEAREAERAMVFRALRQRRARATPQGVLAAILHMLGAV